MHGSGADIAPRDPADRGGALEVYTHAAALYVAMLKNGFFDEATEFAEWFMDAFDYDLED